MAIIKYPFGAIDVESVAATKGYISVDVSSTYTIIENTVIQKGAKQLALVIDSGIPVGSRLDFITIGSLEGAASSMITFSTGFALIATYPIATLQNTAVKKYTTMSFTYNGSAFVPMAAPY